MTAHTGEAYILRTCKADMTSYNGFVWPRAGLVEAPDWSLKPECGGGLHGFLWGEGNGKLADWGDDAVWLVARISEWVDLDGKVKFPSAEVVFAGGRKDATDFIINKGARGAVIGALVVTGNYGQAAAGYFGQATAGHFGQATAGDFGRAIAGNYGRAIAGNYGQASAGNGGQASAGYSGRAIAGEGGQATAGYSGRAIAGYSGRAIAGYRGQASAGNGGQASAGNGGQASAGDYGILSIKWHDGTSYRIAVAYVGEDGIKPNTPYRVEGGKFVEVAE